MSAADPEAHARSTRRILILGASGQIARVATRLFLAETDAELTLYLRRSRRLKELREEERIRIVEGDVLVGPTGYAVATLVALVFPPAALVVFLLLNLFYLWPRKRVPS